MTILIPDWPELLPLVPIRIPACAKEQDFVYLSFVKAVIFVEHLALH